MAATPVVYSWIISCRHPRRLAHDTMSMGAKPSTHLNHSFHIGSCTIVPRVMNRNATRGMTGPCAAHFSCSTQSGHRHSSVVSQPTNA